MDIRIVISQMCVMLIIILIGYMLFHKNKLSDSSSGHISGLVVNICNPATIICSALDKEAAISVKEMLSAAFVMLCIYALLLLAGWLLPLIMRIPKEDRYMYHFMTVYGNVGFLGIPLVSAVLGTSALVYVSINCVIFNLLFYTVGTSIIEKKAAAKQSGTKVLLFRIVNVGTVSSVLTIILYLVDFKLPAVISDTITYAGRATTFLSMIVLGVSVAQMPLKEIFCHKKDYLFIVLRMLLLPICFSLLLKQFVTDPLLLGTSALLLAVPCGNLPLMCAREHKLAADDLARMIILSTLLSVVTIPLAVMFL
ncbi:MAG: AEC family transporter [Eubacteriales bacterium]|nr:AEC family transporter [Eubacteriales bacterium]